MKSGRKIQYIHMADGDTMRAYRVNEYEHDLLRKIRDYEGYETEAETLRTILREAARTRGLHPVMEITE